MFLSDICEVVLPRAIDDTEAELSGAESDDAVEVDIATSFGINQVAVSGLQSPLEHRPIFILAQWKERVTRDGRISLLVPVPSGCLDVSGASAQLLGDSALELKMV